MEGSLGPLDTRGGVHTLPVLEAQAQNSLSKSRWPLPSTSSILISSQYPLPNTASSLPRSWTPTLVSAGLASCSGNIIALYKELQLERVASRLNSNLCVLV